jgi:hypothetical protein
MSLRIRKNVTNFYISRPAAVKEAESSLDKDCHSDFEGGLLYSNSIAKRPEV